MEGDNGSAVLDPAAQKPHEGDDELGPDQILQNPAELVIDGSTGQLSLDVGGVKEPTTSTLRLVGGRIEVEGEFKKGDVLAVRLEAVVNEVSFKDTHDSTTGQVVACARNHRARVTGVQVL